MSEEGEAVKALEAAAEAYGAFLGRSVTGTPAQKRTARVVVAAYLDSLLGDIPEEAVEAAHRASAASHDAIRAELTAALESLRSSLGGTDG